MRTLAGQSSSGCAYRQLGEGPAIVLLHGIPGSGQAWEAVAAELARETRVIVPDLLGFGSSRRPNGLRALHAEAQAAAMADLLDEMEVRDAVVVGHDFGGPVAIALASRRSDQVRALGLLATNAFPDTPIPFPMSMVNWPVAGLAARLLLFSPMSLRMMLRQAVGPGTAPPDPAAYLGDREQRKAIATIFAGSLTNLAELYAPIERQLRALRIPVYVGWGDKDPIFPLDQGQRTAHAAGTTLRGYPGAGHFLPYERPGEVAADILGLLAATGSR